MPSRNWAYVTSGPTFESLATTVVFFEDPGAALFGKRGKDGGQDARSSDGTLVYQAKHHQRASAAKAIADAKSEAKRVVEYRTVGHQREPQWRAVTHWRLVTNATFNPTDKQRWNSEIVPLFASTGLTVDYWEQANLEALLDKHPEIDRAYFGNATRAFLTVPEVRNLLPSREPFLRREILCDFVGRQMEIERVRSFLSSQSLYLVVHGAGGVGKTRLAVEVAEHIAEEGVWQVLWANVASMESSSAWFDAIVPERRTLLIVDEPGDERLLRILTEQLGSRIGRVAQWKVVVTVRSPKDPVLKFMLGPRVKHLVETICIDALPEGDAELMCAELIQSGGLARQSPEWQEKAATVLARRFSRFPVWMTLAVHVLESSGDLRRVPETAEDLAELYLSEVIFKHREQGAPALRALINWIALIGTVNREDDSVVQILGQRTQLGSNATVRQALSGLVGRKALVERGARCRLLELKPDVLRDYVLLQWLTVDVDAGVYSIQPSDDAMELCGEVLRSALMGALDVVNWAILTSLALNQASS